MITARGTFRKSGTTYTLYGVGFTLDSPCSGIMVDVFTADDTGWYYWSTDGVNFNQLANNLYIFNYYDGWDTYYWDGYYVEQLNFQSIGLWGSPCGPF
jgi:hypothetical protein